MHRDHRQQGPEIAKCSVCRRGVRQLQANVIVSAVPLRIRHEGCRGPEDLDQEAVQTE